MVNINEIINQLNIELSKAITLEHINVINLKYVAGKSSIINEATASISTLKTEDRSIAGVAINTLKENVISLIQDRKNNIISALDEGEENFDVSIPTRLPKMGRLSPDTEVIRMMNSFFTYHGYSIAEGPDIETDDFNFERTNLPKDHPARDLQDTIYIKNPDILLRTHTSNVETRILSSQKPPFRFVVPGICYRNEILNASNHALFQQYQGVVVDKNISLANLKGTLEEFAKYMYGQDVKTRFRTKYYPEVEPGAGMDIQCTFCKGDGCTVCKGRGWIEILGSGIIHRNTLQRCGIDFNEWSGFAFGMGLDRIIMTKYSINDIRDLHGGNLVYEDTF